MAAYPGSLTVGAARARYFTENGFGSDGGYSARWVKLKAGPIPIYIPNTPGRKRGVPLHDIHHVLTEYDTDWTGEAEIGAWEISSGCADHYTAWALNLSAMAIGLVIAPRAVFRAFVRGRHSRNLYPGEFRESLLAGSLAELRRQLDLDRATPKAIWRDRMAFAGWSVLSLAGAVAPWLFLLAFIAWLVPDSLLAPAGSRQV